MVHCWSKLWSGHGHSRAYFQFVAPMWAPCQVLWLLTGKFQCELTLTQFVLHFSSGKQRSLRAQSTSLSMECVKRGMIIIRAKSFVAWKSSSAHVDGVNRIVCALSEAQLLCASCKVTIEHFLKSLQHFSLMMFASMDSAESIVLMFVFCKSRKRFS